MIWIVILKLIGQGFGLVETNMAKEIGIKLIGIV